MAYTLFVFSSLLATVSAAVPSARHNARQSTINPIQVASTNYLGFRYTDNDQTVRDLGYQGKIGRTRINTFGDGVGATNAKSETNAGCAFITARDGAAVQGSDPLIFHDINTRTDLCRGVPQMARFCPLLAGEVDSSGLGITNVVQVDGNTGLILTRPTQCNGSDCPTSGAGFAKVDISSGTPVCTRSFGISSWGAGEPNWGQLGLILDGGFIYAFANGNDNTVVLARVPQARAFNINSWQYWHGSNGGWNGNRIQLSQLSSSSPELLNFTSGQGSVFFSTFYNKYIYLSAFGDIYTHTADSLAGPWSSNSVSLFTPPNLRNIPYAPTIQSKFTSADGSQVLIGWTDSNRLGLMQVTFRK